MMEREQAVSMGFDAFRICIGLAPKHWTPAEVIRWIQTIAHLKHAKVRK